MQTFSRFLRHAKNPNLSIKKVTNILHSPIRPLVHEGYFFHFRRSSICTLPQFHHHQSFLNFYRCIHAATTENTEVGISNDAEKLCKILSAHGNSSEVEAKLDSAGVDLTETIAAEVLKNVRNAGVLSLSFFRWAEKQKGFKHTTAGYNSLIESLGKIKQFSMIWSLVSDMKRRSLLTKETFGLISRRYARARRPKDAMEAFQKMETFGFKMELEDYNRLLDTLSKSKHVAKAQEVFDKMKNRKFKPDIKTYTILLEGWGLERNFLRLDEVFREMKADGFEPDVITYGIIISAYCKDRKYDEALKNFHQMEASNIKPSPHIFSTLINGMGADKRLSEAFKFFELYKESGFPPELPTFNALMGAFCWSQQMEDAYKVIDDMRKFGVGPNSRTLDIILYHLIKAGRTKEAYSVFVKMGGEKGCEPSVSTYEIIVRMFCNEDRIDMAIMIWNQMREKGILPGMHMFSTLINSLCNEGNLDDACKYFVEMLDMGIRAPAQLFSNLKQALLDEGKEDVVIRLGLKLEKLRKTPLVG